MTTAVPLAVVLLLLLACCSAADLQQESDKLKKEHFPPADKNLPACDYMADGKGNVPKYHMDDTCDRTLANHPASRSIRAERYNALLQTGVDHIPDEATAVCPQQVENWESSVLSEYGHNTKLLIDNEATTPVVVIFLKNGIEYSAMNAEITPPHHDPITILQPGEWANLNVFEGHVFYVRELTKEGGLGPILVQHRTGIVPITNKSGSHLHCEKPNFPEQHHLEQLPPKKQEQLIKQALDQVDPEPKVPVVTTTNPRQLHDADNADTKIDPEWDRTHPHYEERCHIIYKGFRNMVDGCALNMMYVGMQVPPTSGPMACREEFKFHLGLHPSPDDYMHSWESRTKFEATFVGHTWVARLASDMDIVVDTYTVTPIVVRDCPLLKNTQVTVGLGAELNGIGRVQSLQANLTHMISAANMTANAAAAHTNVHSI